MRDRLIELLKMVEYQYTEIHSIMTQNVADFLLQKGVIVPPCKVGDTIYVIPSKANFGLNIVKGFERLNRIYEQKVEEIRIYQSGDYLLFACEKLQCVHSKLYKETWFLSREEAEQALGKLQASYEQVKEGAE